LLLHVTLEAPAAVWRRARIRQRAAELQFSVCNRPEGAGSKPARSRIGPQTLEFALGRSGGTPEFHASVPDEMLVRRVVRQDAWSVLTEVRFFEYNVSAVY
jgi:hypothetical protein